MYQIFNTLLQDRLLLKPRKSLDKTIQNISSAPGKKPSRSGFFFNKTISFIKRKSLVHIFKFKILLPFSFEAGILPTSLRCSAHVVLNSSDLTSSYPITSSTQRITTTEFKDVNHEDLILSIQIMKNSLAVNKSETSSEIRKKISVYESRTSAVSMGLIGTIVIVLVILCPVISDLTSVIQRRKK